VDQIKDANVKIQKGKACAEINKELNSQLTSVAQQRQQDSLKINDYMKKESVYMANDSIRLSQIQVKQNLANEYKKKAKRDKWIWGGAGLGLGIAVGILAGFLSK